MKEVLARALRALAVAPLNCSLILDAGGLQPLADMLAGHHTELSHQAVAVMALLTKVICPLIPSAFCDVTVLLEGAIAPCATHCLLIQQFFDSPPEQVFGETTVWNNHLLCDLCSKGTIL